MYITHKMQPIMKITNRKPTQNSTTVQQNKNVGGIRLIKAKPGEFDAVLKKVLPGMRATIEFLKDK